MSEPTGLDSEAICNSVFDSYSCDSPPKAAAKKNCTTNAGDDVISCYPTADTVVLQDEFTALVWNSNLPDFIQTGLTFITLPETTSPHSDPFAFTAAATATFTSTPRPESTSGSATGSGPPSGDSTVSPSSLPAADIAGVTVASFVAIVMAIATLFIMRRRRRRLARKKQISVDPLPYAEGTFPRSKAELNAEMRAVQGRLRSLRFSNGQTSTQELVEEGEGLGSNSELHRQIAILTAEVERLRSLGAEEPPPYSLQPE
ncbi:hypothetical protein DFH08DRAFT_825634 [Mycena albidolilacea]|uniref:Uncharacterized protein n=1 Tax=Mycena albidolilacea TaxID=1033008 RepID=A0AAD7E9Y7_9AGAR|nr:hypothetical protein DFH08DRAFT_825634 [Mycena albidolilacea]